MNQKYKSFGEIVQLDGANTPFLTKEMLMLWDACNTDSRFCVRHLTRYYTENNNYIEALVVDCINNVIKSKNKFNIRANERLAIGYNPYSLSIPYAVFALREEFPDTLHQNYHNEIHGSSLCLYEEPWREIERKWTPQKFLDRICNWLILASKGELHQRNQPLERLFFDSPFEIILPQPTNEQRSKSCYSLRLVQLNCDSLNLHVTFRFSQNFNSSNLINNIMVINLPAIVHRRTDLISKDTLEGLKDFLQSKVNFNIYLKMRDLLLEMLKDHVELSYDLDNKNIFSILILNISFKREEDQQPERVDSYGFVLEKHILDVAQYLGLLHGFNDMKIRKFCLATKSKSSLHYKMLNDIPIIPAKITYILTKTDTQTISDIAERKNICGVIAGVGSLGSSMIEIWSRELWGTWTLIDNDIFRAHNIVRHIGKNMQIGQSKVDVVNKLVNCNYLADLQFCNAIAKEFNVEDSQINDVLAEADIFVDATTTLTVPRNISYSDNMPRAVSVFLSPSATSGILLMEDKHRSIRLLSLEGQYYRAIIKNNNTWGRTHLEYSKGPVHTGLGCREMSNKISFEKVLLFASILANQIRTLVDDDMAQIMIWNIDSSKNYSVLAENIPAYKTYSKIIKGWKIFWDEYIENKITSYRKTNLPKETGGIIIGFIDNKLKCIVIVDISDAPVDSVKSPSSFIRGTNNLQQYLDDVEKLTQHEVSYLGEWHSHPKGCSAELSSDDHRLLEYLSSQRCKEGEPVIMIVVGDTEHPINITLA